MPTAEKGDFFHHASIADWVGAMHWSKPWPVKSPGVASAIWRWEARRGAVVASPALAGADATVGAAEEQREDARARRRMGDSGGAGGRAGPTTGCHTSHTCHSGSRGTTTV